MAKYQPRFKDLVMEFLEREIPKMGRASMLYKTLKAQLKARRNWKNLPRGKPGNLHSGPKETHG